MHRLLPAILAVAISWSSGLASAGEPEALSLSRVGGADRYDTAVQTVLTSVEDFCRRQYGDAPDQEACIEEDLGSMTLVRGDSFADALSAASVQSGPILITPRDQLPPAIEVLQDRFQFQATIVGDVSVVSAAVEDEIGEDYAGTTSRVAGATRIDTAVAVARFHQNIYDAPQLRHIAIVNAERWPDALAAGVMAGPQQIVLPVYQDRIPSVIASLISETTSADYSELTVIGGPAAISEAVVDELRALTTAQVRRVGGADRFETARLVADFSFRYRVENFDPERQIYGVLIVRPDDYADAIAAPNLMRSRGAPILIAKSADRLGDANARWLQDNGPALITITGLGDATVVSDDVLQAAYEAGCTNRIDC